MLQVYNTKKLKDAQDASLEILLEVDRICRSRGIRYMLDAGTLLGAVRHKGFIPWDDDVDIAMTRDNFDLFRKAASDELPESMELVMPDAFQNGKAFYDFTPRIIYLNSRRHVVSEEMDFYDGKLNHLWVDIFILDNITDSSTFDKLTRFRQKMLYGYAMAHRYSLDLSKYSDSDRRKVEFLVKRGKGKAMRDIFRAQEELSVKYNGRQTKNLYYSNYQPDYLHDTVKREWISEVTELEFEGHQLMAPKGWHEVLTVIYGDYMQMPPEEKRVPSHSDDLEVYPDGEPPKPITRS